jgi:hypothetical protein
LDTFNRVQELFFKKRENTNTINKNTRRAQFILKGFIVCPRCTKLLTASFSQGRKLKYCYYHCRTSCGYCIRTVNPYEKLILKLKEIKPLPEYNERFKTLIQFNYSKQKKVMDVKRLRELNTIELFTDRIYKAKNLLLDGHLEFQDYLDIKSDLGAKIRLMGYSIEANLKKQVALSNKIEEVTDLFSNLHKFVSMLEENNRHAFLDYRK